MWLPSQGVPWWPFAQARAPAGSQAVMTVWLLWAPPGSFLSPIPPGLGRGQHRTLFGRVAPGLGPGGTFGAGPPGGEDTGVATAQRGHRPAARSLVSRRLPTAVASALGRPRRPHPHLRRPWSGAGAAAGSCELGLPPQRPLLVAQRSLTAGRSSRQPARWFPHIRVGAGPCTFLR